MNKILLNSTSLLSCIDNIFFLFLHFFLFINQVFITPNQQIVINSLDDNKLNNNTSSNNNNVGIANIVIKEECDDNMNDDVSTLRYIIFSTLRHYEKWFFFNIVNWDIFSNKYHNFGSVVETILLVTFTVFNSVFLLCLVLNVFTICM